MVTGILIACAAAATVLGLLNNRYGPLQGGEFGGPLGNDLTYSKDGESFRLISAPGRAAPVMGSLYNSGAHAVTIRSVSAGHLAPDTRWSVYRTVPDGLTTGVDTPWRSFPATIPAYGYIRLLLTLHRPITCPPDAAQHGEGSYDGSAEVHWQSLLQSHTTFATVLAMPITIC